ncbi:sodium-glucose/galactose cotransporter [Clostridium tetanomorphum DSM 665]|nr:sodium-glucose/galactose cotransporter [Clostridium tetanomorphum DSM 665]
MFLSKLHLFLIISIIIILIWSGINPFDSFTWFLEVLPALIGGTILVIIYSKFKFTTLVYILIWIHGIILIVGGHYTYAEMPLFNWLKDTFNLERNYYDRLGHIAQGFIPAIVTREIFIRKNIVSKKGWLGFIIVSICLAASASYELIEFAVAKFTGTAAEAFLGTQGDVWDTQWDMLFALVGSILSLVILSKYHDEQLERIKL